MKSRAGLAYGAVMFGPRFAPLALSAVAIVVACATPPAETPEVPPGAADSASPGARCVADASAALGAVTDEPREIEVAHVLVKWSGADRADASIARDREEACLRAVEALQALKNGESFEDVVATYSDEAGAETRGGVIGEVSREDVAAAFADAAFRLEVGQVSHVVESPFGFHLILRSR